MPSVLPIYANKTMPRKNSKNGINITERTMKDRVSKMDTEDMMSWYLRKNLSPQRLK